MDIDGLRKRRHRCIEELAGLSGWVRGSLVQTRRVQGAGPSRSAICPGVSAGGTGSPTWLPASCPLFGRRSKTDGARSPCSGVSVN